MTRSVPEWVADHDDQAIPPRVRLRIYERCGGKCAITGVKVRPGHFDYDHIIALANGGTHAETNLQIVAREAHREKTADDVKLKAKLQRIAAKHAGTWPLSPTPLKSRGFPKRETR